MSAIAALTSPTNDDATISTAQAAIPVAASPWRAIRLLPVRASSQSEA
jgi:hypothetical protein